jgi:tetratricopeptide (TPR) repeat protein
MRQVVDAQIIDWDKLAEFADTIKASQFRRNYATEVGTLLNRTMTLLSANQDWQGIIRLRTLFDFLGRGEPLGLGNTLGELNRRAIAAAHQMGNHVAAGQFLHEEGQALHRHGNHPEAIKAFEQSTSEYKLIGESFHARESYYMTALCHRAMGNRSLARKIVRQVLNETRDDAWRANPLIVLSWLAQDDGDLKQAEDTMRQAIATLEASKGMDDVLVGQSLADLGELVGFQGRRTEAHEIFERALAIFARDLETHQRQTARTLLKQAEVYLRTNEFDKAMALLRQAYLTIAEAQYNDLMWRILLAMAQIDLKRRELAEFARHLQLALEHRHAIGLSDWSLVKQYLDRQKMGTGLPR